MNVIWDVVVSDVIASDASLGTTRTQRDVGDVDTLKNEDGELEVQLVESGQI